MAAQAFGELLDDGGIGQQGEAIASVLFEAAYPLVDVPSGDTGAVQQAHEERKAVTLCPRITLHEQIPEDLFHHTVVPHHH